MYLLYNIFLRLYFLLVQVCSLFNKKAEKWISGRKNWEALLAKRTGSGQKWIWFHCSSLGEYEDCSSVFKQLKKDNPSKKFLLTFFSPSGYEVLKNSREYDLVMYLPLDTRRNAKKFLYLLQPEFIFFSRSELWFNFINEIKKRDTPLFVLSLKLNNNSNFLKWPAKELYKCCFSAFTHIYCQDDITLKILQSDFSSTNASVTGNTRFDRIYEESFSAIDIPGIEQFTRNNFAIVAGSLLPKDEVLVLQAFRELVNYNIKFIIVPHEINSRQITQTIKSNQCIAIKYSDIDKLNEFHSLLYIDSVGILKYLYQYADFAIVGGGFDSIGIHNIIEPAAYGIKTSFGPNHKNYREAMDIINIGGATIYHNAEDLVKIITNKLSLPDNEKQKNRIISYVKGNTGGSAKIIESIRKQYPGSI